MKKFLTLFLIVATLATAQQASAQFITRVNTSAGGTGTVNITGDATLTSFIAGDTFYDSFIGLGVNDATPPVRLWGNTISDPGSDTIAVSDLNLGTGTLNNGRDAIFDLTGQTLDATTTIFIFGNGNGSVTVDPDNGNAIESGGTTPPSVVTFVDATGAALGTVAADFWFQDPIADGGANAVRAPNLLSFDFARDDDPLPGRTVSGAVFTLADITFTTGGIADIAGFTIFSTSSDVNDVGIAFPGEMMTLLGDVNLDGTVNFLDITPFIAAVSGGSTQAEADINGSGTVDFLDITPFIALLSAP